VKQQCGSDGDGKVVFLLGRFKAEELAEAHMEKKQRQKSRELGKMI
jgi:hypothetical protein